MCISVSGFYSCHDQQHRPGRKHPWLSDGPLSLRPGAVFPLCLRCWGSLPGLTRVMFIDLQIKRKHLRLLGVHAKEPPDFQLDTGLVAPRPGQGRGAGASLRNGTCEYYTSWYLLLLGWGQMTGFRLIG
uniref:Uncharacterized protein n=1 Tax=Rousettus aegyptiacus TaxID=9407 RepID=A0A7J8C2B2_ROUAE|nr:hypothetical protein HJG63_009334 [Rousettus aegyptiacus]